MDEFEINFNIFGKDGDFESWLKAELSSPVKKRKIRKVAKRERQNGTTGSTRIEHKKEHGMGHVRFEILVSGEKPVNP